MGAFHGCAAALYDRRTIPGVDLVDGWAVEHYMSLRGSLDLTGVRGIAKGAFSECHKLTSVTIRGDVKSIGDEAFKLCLELTSVTLHGGVKTIGNGTFKGCDNLVSVKIPDSLE